MWSLLLGPLIGLIGGGLTRWQETAAKKADYAHELALREADAKIMAQEWAQRTKVAEVEAAGRVEVEDSKAFGMAVQAEAMRYSQGIRASGAQAWLMFTLDFIRGIVRPGLTLYLCVLTTLVYLQAREALPMLQDSASSFELVKDITLRVVTLTEAMVFYWFGTRQRGGK